MNASDPEALQSLGKEQFDAAVCTMGLMDMASIEPLISTLPALLKPGGRFVFSVTHPVFNSGRARRIAEEQDLDGELVTTFGAIVTDYSIPYMHMGLGIAGAAGAAILLPQANWYAVQHRASGTASSWTGWRSRRCQEGTEARADRPLSWAHFHNIPQVLVARMRLAGAKAPTGLDTVC